WLFLAACASGAILLYSSPLLPPLRIFAVTPGIVAVLWFVRRQAGPTRARLWWVMLAGLVVGTGWTAWHAGKQQSSALPAELEGEPLQV
ncbi:hypothetical protein DF186_16870, partial [Enterococcus hirae]